MRETTDPVIVGRVEELINVRIVEPVYNIGVLRLANLLVGARVRIRITREEIDASSRISRFVFNRSFIAHESSQEISRIFGPLKVGALIQASQHLCNTSSNIVEALVEELPAPPPPQLIEPWDGQNGVSRTPTFRWRDPAAGQPNAVINWFLLPPESSEIEIPVRLSEWQLREPLEFDTEYGWTLQGINANGLRSRGSFARFRTRARFSGRTPSPTPVLLRFSELQFYNCTVEQTDIHYWIRNVSRGEVAFREVGSQSHQFNDIGTCPPLGSTPFRIDLPNDGDVYEVVAVTPNLIGCGVNDPTIPGCRKWDEQVMADSNAGPGTFTF